MSDTTYHELFPLGADEAPYRKLTGDHVATGDFEGRRIVKVEPEALTLLAAQAFADSAHLLRPGHLASLRAILDDPEASSNDKFVAFDLLKNANIAAGRVLPMCQDTGTAIVMGKKGQQVWTEGDDAAAISAGIRRTYTETNLRYSQVAPLSMYEEVNTGDNLPAQIDLYAEPGEAYKFLFIAKGGGSANKSFLYQQTKAVLNPKSLRKFLDEKIRTLGTAACPPYHLAIVIGGTSAEMNLKTVKLASCRYLDCCRQRAIAGARPTATANMKARCSSLPAASASARSSAASISATTCGSSGCRATAPACRSGSACRARPTARSSARSPPRASFSKRSKPTRRDFCPRSTTASLGGEVVPIDLARPMGEIRRTLSQYPIKTRLSLTGPLIVARDIAHAKLQERLDRGLGLPDYVKNHPIYYAGPAKTPQGYASGSFGPTTAGRMDSYVDAFMAAGGSFVSLAKGNRGAEVRDACRRHGGFYLGSIGGPAARLALECIRKVELLEYPELGMEAIWRIEVADFPAFIVIDDKGNDFFAALA